MAISLAGDLGDHPPKQLPPKFRRVGGIFVVGVIIVVLPLISIATTISSNLLTISYSIYKKNETSVLGERDANRSRTFWCVLNDDNLVAASFFRHFPHTSQSLFPCWSSYL